MQNQVNRRRLTGVGTARRWPAGHAGSRQRWPSDTVPLPTAATGRVAVVEQSAELARMHRRPTLQSRESAGGIEKIDEVAPAQLQRQP